MKNVKNIKPITEPLNEFWETFHKDQFFKWVIDSAQKKYKAEINLYNLN